MNIRTPLLVAGAFCAGALFALAARKPKFDAAALAGKSDPEAAEMLLARALELAKDDTWERIGVARVYYLSGRKAEGQRILDSVLNSSRAQASDYFRAARVYQEAGDWALADRHYQIALQRSPGDPPWSAEYGAMLSLNGERDKGRRMALEVIEKEPGDTWNVIRAACAYANVRPQTD